VSNGSITEKSSGGATGPGYVKFFASSTADNSWIFQTARLWNGYHSGKVRAVLNAKAPDTGITSKARATVFHRYMADGVDANGCDYRSGIDNPNEVTYFTGYIIGSSSMVTLGTSWTSVASDWIDLGYGGHEIQVRAYANSAGDHSVALDNVRGEWK